MKVQKDRPLFMGLLGVVQRRVLPGRSRGAGSNSTAVVSLASLPGLLLCGVLSGCVVEQPGPLSQRNSALTQGNVQLNLVVGETTKADVLETFGAPNVTTRDGSGREVWTWQRAAQVNQSSSNARYWTILVAGGARSASGFESSSSMITLIIKFDENDVVTDFSSRSANF